MTDLGLLGLSGPVTLACVYDEQRRQYSFQVGNRTERRIYDVTVKPVSMCTPSKVAAGNAAFAAAQIHVEPAIICPHCSGGTTGSTWTLQFGIVPELPADATAPLEAEIIGMGPMQRKDIGYLFKSIARSADVMDCRISLVLTFASPINIRREVPHDFAYEVTSGNVTSYQGERIVHEAKPPFTFPATALLPMAPFEPKFAKSKSQEKRLAVQKAGQRWPSPPKTKKRTKLP